MKKEKKYIEYILKQAEALLAIDSPSGFTEKVTDYLCEEYNRLGYKPVKTKKGGVLVEIGGKGNAVLTMAHVDTLGGMVSAVSLECEAPRGVLTASGGAEIGIKLILPENVPAPVETGDVLGTAEVALNGDTVQSLKITAKTEAPAITFSSALQYFLACFFAAEAA